MTSNENIKFKSTKNGGQYNKPHHYFSGKPKIAMVKNITSLTKISNFEHRKWEMATISVTIECFLSHGRDRMVVGFTTTCVISAYHH